ncbi:MAG: TraB/GumN family protein [Candidatus Melainabacteria bacterium]|nr:MAG: TraB/GumN family protein [Candidatus Melainabacteria bacterium]
MNIRTRVLSVALGISLFAPNSFSCAYGEENKDAPVQNATALEPLPKAKENAKLYLWKATRGNTTIYLLGTMHFAMSSLYPLPKEMEDAFTQSKHLIVEARIDEVDQSKLNQGLKSLMLFSPPDKLSNHLTDSTKSALSDYLKWAGESSSLYESWKPWFLASYVNASIMKREGLKSELGIDRHFLKKAKEQNKAVSQLESVESQLKLLGGFPMDAQDKMLRISLLQLKNNAATLKLIEECWRDGDADSIAKLTNQEAESDSELKSVQRKIYEERNQSMTSKLLLLLTVPGPHFVAIGAAHLAGEESVLEHLKEQGFTIEQMRSSTKLASSASSRAIDLDSVINKSDTKNTDKFKMTSASKMSKLHFTEGRFSVLMPGTPEVKCKNENGMRLVDYQYTEAHGTLNISYAIMPKQLPLTAQKQVLNLISAGVAKSIKGTEIARHSFNYQGVYPGLQVEVAKVQGNAKLMARFRYFMVGRYLYIVGSAGSKEWLSSPIVSEFINSVAVHRETPHNELAVQEAKKRHEEFQTNFEARRRKFDQDFRDQQSRNRLQMEGARAAHERMFGRR